METWIADALKNGSGIGAFAVAAFFIWKIIVAVQARRQNGAANAAHSHPPGATPAAGLPMLGGTNPAAGETTGVNADPRKAPVTHGECEDKQNLIGEKLTNINTKLGDTNDRINRMDTKLSENTKGIYDRLDETNKSMNDAVTKLNAGVASIDAVIKDRTNRGG